MVFIVPAAGFGDMSERTSPKLHVKSAGSTQRSWNSYQVWFFTHGHRPASENASLSRWAWPATPRGEAYSLPVVEVGAPYSVIQTPTFGLPICTRRSWKRGTWRNPEPGSSGAILLYGWIPKPST